MYEERVYRELHKSKDLINYEVINKESDLMVSSDVVIKDEISVILEKYRLIIKETCEKYDYFEESLVPLDIQTEEAIINQMLEAGKIANVGPMAAVAGSISEFVAKEAVGKKLVKQIIIENGGDVYICSNIDRRILIYAGKSPFSNNLGILIKKELMPVGICTSAGTVGHSLSFGKTDAVVVISKNTSLADAMATSIGNIVKSNDDIQKGIDFGSQVDGIIGILIIVGDQLGVWGNIELFNPAE